MQGFNSVFRHIFIAFYRPNIFTFKIMGTPERKTQLILH